MSSSTSCPSLQELLVVQVAAEIEALRSNLILLEKSTIDTLRNENEVITNFVFLNNDSILYCYNTGFSKSD